MSEDHVFTLDVELTQVSCGECGGTCTFENLQRHMSEKHPSWNDTEET